MKIGDFFIELGIHADTFKVKDLVHSIAELPVEAAGAIASLAGIDYEIVKLTGEAMEAAVGFERFTTQTGLSAQELQKWQIVAAQADVNAEAVASSVSGLQRQLAEIRLGGGNIAPYQLLGIDPHQNAFGVLSQLRERIKGLDRPTATNLISQMGLSPDMMQVLTLSDQKFAQFSHTVAGMSERQQQAFLKTKLALTQLGLEFKQFSFEHLGNFLNGITHAIELAGHFTTALKAIGVVAAVLAAEFFPLTATLAALFLVLEDIGAYESGNKHTALGHILGRSKFMGSEADYAKMNWPKALGAGFPVAAAGGPSVTHVTVSQKNDIHVHGNDAHANAHEVARQLDRQTSNATLQVNKGDRR